MVPPDKNKLKKNQKNHDHCYHEIQLQENLDICIHHIFGQYVGAIYKIAQDEYCMNTIRKYCSHTQDLSVYQHLYGIAREYLSIKDETELEDSLS